MTTSQPAPAQARDGATTWRATLNYDNGNEPTAPLPEGAEPAEIELADDALPMVRAWTVATLTGRDTPPGAAGGLRPMWWVDISRGTYRADADGALRWEPERPAEPDALAGYAAFLTPDGEVRWSDDRDPAAPGTEAEAEPAVPDWLICKPAPIPSAWSSDRLRPAGHDHSDRPGPAALPTAPNVLRPLDERKLTDRLKRMWERHRAGVRVLPRDVVPVGEHPTYGRPGPAHVRNPFWDLVRLLPQQHPTPDDTPPAPASFNMNVTQQDFRDLDLPLEYRDPLCRRYSYAIPSPGDLEFLTGHLDGRAVLEHCAGTGYWSWMLQQSGVDVVAYDTGEWIDSGLLDPRPHFPVVRAGVEALAAHPDRALMLVWPPMERPAAAELLAAYTGDTVIYAGGAGLTGDETFRRALREEWDLIESSPHHLAWWGFGAFLSVFRRAPGGRSAVSRLLARFERLRPLLEGAGVGGLTAHELAELETILGRIEGDDPDPEHP